MRSNFMDRLQAALERRRTGDSEPPSDLSAKERQELESLLETAVRVEALPRIEPPADALARCLSRLDHAAARRRATARSTRRRWVLAWVAGMLIIAVAAGGATVTAARDTLPGQRLYPVKRAAEDVRLLLIRDAAGRVEWCLSMSEQRCREFIVTAKTGCVDPSTLNAMLASSQRALHTAELAAPAHRERLVARVGERCLEQGVTLAGLKQSMAVGDTALINAAIAACNACGRSCGMCAPGSKPEPESTTNSYP